MYTGSSLLALSALLSSALGAYQGFNYGSTFTTGAAKQQSDFEAEFKTAQGLVGAPGVFSSGRLYTMVQGGTASNPISAIPAAISTGTNLLLGLWASGGDAGFQNELTALKAAIQQYSGLGKIAIGISVGSEDLYRISPTGIINKENPGAEPATIVNYIKQVRDTIRGTSLANVPVGHVDTWTAFVNSSNNDVIAASDFLGVDAYPYFQNTMANSIENSKGLFNDALGATIAAAGGKPVWVTETGFPVSGKTSNLAIPSLDNAKSYWDQVGCPLFGSTNVFWYTLWDSDPDVPNPSFGIVGNTLTTTPLFDLSCKAVSSSSSSSSSAAPSTSSGSGGGSSSGSSSISGSASASGSATSSAPTQTSGSSGQASTTLTTASTTQTSSSSSGTGSGSGSGSSSGSGSGSSGTSVTSSSTTPSPSTISNNAGGVSSSVGAAFIAIMAGILAL